MSVRKDLRSSPAGDVGADSGAPTRTNERWLADLRDPVRSGRAVEDLRVYLRGAMARVLRRRGRVDEADVEDFVQDGLLRILQGLDGFRGNSRFTTWATAVTVRTAFGALRRREYRHVSLEDLELGTAASIPDGVDPSHAFEHSSLLETLHRAIDEDLTERQRTVVLGELAGVPTTVLVERLGTNPNALYKLHHDARKKLKRALADAGYRDEDVRRELEQPTGKP